MPIDRYAVCSYARWWLREPDHEVHVLNKGWTKEADLETGDSTCLGEIDFIGSEIEATGFLRHYGL